MESELLDALDPIQSIRIDVEEDIAEVLVAIA